MVRPPKLLVAAMLVLGLFILAGYAQTEDIPTTRQKAEQAPASESAPAAPAKNAEISVLEDIDQAEVLYEEIKMNGHAQVKGIYFGKDEVNLKVESDLYLGIIAQMLKDHPKMKLYIVGHTDNSGILMNKMRLSLQCAEAVMKALTGRFEIAGERLYAIGVGPLCPVATNDTEQGRVQNDRIELVAQ